jgi:hypothetical protein
MRRILLAIVLLLAPPSASAARFEPAYVGAGTLKIPGIAFDIVGMAQAGPTLSTSEGSAEFQRALKVSFAANGVTLGLHTISVAAFFGSGFDGLEDEESMATAFLINGGCDLGIAVLGLATGIDLLQRRNASGLRGTDLGISAGWSGWVNIAMGSFGAAWFGPMMIFGLLAADEAWGDIEIGEKKPAVEIGGKKPAVELRFEPRGAGFALTGRF